MADEWKGLHLIRSKPKTAEERRSDDCSLISRMGHRKRTAQGCNMSVSGSPWAKTIQRWQKNGKLYEAFE